MGNYLTILTAMFRNKLRLGKDKSKGSAIALFILVGVAYVIIMSSILGAMILLKDFLKMPETARSVYFFVLLTAALIVLVFGVVHLVSTLYLSKDTDFYSALPVKASTVFAAKMSFVYLFETAIVAVVVLPLLIAFGVIINAWAWYYVITILLLLAVPALPLVVAAVISIPVMYLAGKLKNRNIIPLIFYILLFGGFFGAYMYFVTTATSVDVDENTLSTMFAALNAILYVFYPYKALSEAACAVDSFGIGTGLSALANVAIFVGASLALFVIIMFAAKFMYSQAVKANNQTDNSRAKKGDFKASGSMSALIKREFSLSMRSTQTAFQCYAVVILPIIFAVIMTLSMRNLAASDAMTAVMIPKRFVLITVFSVLCAILGTSGNGASTSVSREGTAMASLKTLPISSKQVVSAKIAAWSMVALPAAALSVALVNILMFDWQFMILSVFAVIPLTFAYVVFGVLWDLRKPKLDWTDPMQAVKHNTNVLLGQLCGMIPGLTIMFAAMILNNAFALDINVLSAIVWALIYTEVVVFAVLDIVMLRRTEKYYYRLAI